MFRPKLIEALRAGYSRETFVKDLTAGIIVGIVAIPLAVAFAIASGVKPDVGLLTAVIGGFFISILGGSSVQIGGPTGAFIVIVYGIMSKFGPDGLILATLMAGIMLLALGFGRLGTVIQFIPFPVLVGFTSGIAVIIMSSQINDFLGLGLTNLPADFLPKWELYLSHLSQVNYWALGISVSTIFTILIINRVNKKIPAALVALIAGTLAVMVFKIPVETIGTRFGEISGSIPWPKIPNISLERLQQLLLPAFSIAILAGIESLLSAVVADSMTGKKHHSNTELIAQGFANIASSLFGGIPVTGAIARTATNVKSGGQTPIAGIVHAIFLLGVLLFLSPLAGLIPLAALAGILATVAYNMSEHNTFRMLLKGPRGDILTLLVTFFLTVLVDLTIAIPVGILLALLGFIQKMSTSSQITIHHKEFRDVAPEMDPFGLTAIDLPEGVEIFEIDGPLFFGAAEKIKEELGLQNTPPLVRILRLRDVPSVDSSGIMVIRELMKKAKLKSHLIFAAIQPQVKSAFDKIGLTKEIGEENILPNVILALDRAKKLLGHKESSLLEKLSLGGIISHLEAKDPFEVIQKAVPHLAVPDHLRKHLQQSLLEREELASTGMGHGIAFPHPRNPILPEDVPESISIVYLKDPVNYEAADGIPVHTVFFILSHSVQNHLKVLSFLARQSSSPEFMTLLQNKAGLNDLAKWLEKKNS